MSKAFQKGLEREKWDQEKLTEKGVLTTVDLCKLTSQCKERASGNEARWRRGTWKYGIKSGMAQPFINNPTSIIQMGDSFFKWHHVELIFKALVICPIPCSPSQLLRSRWFPIIIFWWFPCKIAAGKENVSRQTWWQSFRCYNSNSSR